MTFEGVVTNGQIILHEAPPLTEGTRVRVEIQDQPPRRAASPLGEMLLKHAGKAVALPEDAADQHDRDLYGTAKR